MLPDRKFSNLVLLYEYYSSLLCLRVFYVLEVFFEAVAFGARSFCTCALRLELFFVFETKFFSTRIKRWRVEEHTFFVF